MNRNSDGLIKYSFIFLFLSALFLFASSKAVYAGVVFAFEKELVVISPKNKASSPKTTSTILLVEIGKDYFSYEENNKKRIYDFKHHRILEVNKDTGTYLDDSLFMDIGFRDYEFKNRLYLGRALGAASIKDNPMAIPLSEHVFSFTAKKHKTEIKKEIKDKNVIFSWSGKELFKHNQNIVKIKPPYKNGFIRFLRYHLGGHPKILVSLKNLSGIPSSLTMTSYNVQTKITTLRLKSHKYIPDKLPDLKIIKKGVVDGALAPLLSKSTTFSEDALNTTMHSLLAKATSAFNDKRYLDTILIYLEYTLATGKQMPKQFNPQRKLIIADLNVKAFFASIRPKSKEEAQKAVETLVALRDKSKGRLHVLKIFEANTRSSLGMQKESIQLFHAALKKNPYITGAWKDLGELYFRSYNSRDAWRCWDTARKLNPRHKLLTKIKQFEVRLKKDNPDFF